jgi:hypothetical protein
VGYAVCLAWQAWRSFGKLRMEELFAKMGFSLAQCKVRQAHIPRVHAELVFGLTHIAEWEEVCTQF